MKHLRRNISVPEDVWRSLESKIPPGDRSRFVADAIRKSMKEREDTLAKEYEEAFSSDEYKTLQEDWGSLDAEGLSE